jgi:hypothetical protein
VATVPALSAIRKAQHVARSRPLALNSPKDPYGLRAWIARQHDAKGDPPCINGYFVGMTAEKIANAIGMTGVLAQQLGCARRVDEIRWLVGPKSYP